MAKIEFVLRERALAPVRRCPASCWLRLLSLAHVLLHVHDCARPCALIKWTGDTVTAAVRVIELDCCLFVQESHWIFKFIVKFTYIIRFQ